MTPSNRLLCGKHLAGKPDWSSHSSAAMASLEKLDPVNYVVKATEALAELMAP